MVKKSRAVEVEERFNAVVEEFGVFLRRAIVRMCPRDKGLQFDDIEQEARLRLWRALQSEREVTNYASYLYRIAATATIDAMRRIQARHEEQLDILTEQRADDGEILIGSDDVFDGYWRDDAATQAAFIVDQEGARWLRSGDVGQWQGDALKIVDRARDFIVTAGGKTLSPSFIENHLRAIPYVGEAMVVGHGRKYLTALIEIDFESVADWARGEGLTYTGFTSLVDHPRVQRLMAGEITRVNGALSRVEQIKSFRILPKALDPEEEGEPVTPTRKLKRARMLERFGPLVEAMYDNDEEQRVAADVGDVLRT